MKYNLFLAFSQQAVDEYKLVIQHIQDGTLDEYTGPMTQEVFSIIKRAHGLETQGRIFKPFEAGNGKTYRLISLFTDEDSNIDKIREKLAYLEQEWPQHFDLCGVWQWNGLQCGQYYDENGDIAGTPDEPLDHNKLLKFMPDVMTDPGDPEADPAVPPTYEPATELTDVHLMLGQSPRNFD